MLLASLIYRCEERESDCSSSYTSKGRGRKEQGVWEGDEEGESKQEQGEIKGVKTGGQEKWISRWENWILSEYLYSHMNWFLGPCKHVHETVR